MRVVLCCVQCLLGIASAGSLVAAGQGKGQGERKRTLTPATDRAVVPRVGRQGPVGGQPWLNSGDLDLALAWYPAGEQGEKLLRAGIERYEARIKFLWGEWDALQASPAVAEIRRLHEIVHRPPTAMGVAFPGVDPPEDGGSLPVDHPAHRALTRAELDFDRVARSWKAKVRRLHRETLAEFEVSHRASNAVAIETAAFLGRLIRESLNRTLFRPLDDPRGIPVDPLRLLEDPVVDEILTRHGFRDEVVELVRSLDAEAGGAFLADFASERTIERVVAQDTHGRVDRIEQYRRGAVRVWRLRQSDFERVEALLIARLRSAPGDRRRFERSARGLFCTPLQAEHWIVGLESQLSEFEWIPPASHTDVAAVLGDASVQCDRLEMSVVSALERIGDGFGRVGGLLPRQEDRVAAEIAGVRSALAELDRLSAERAKAIEHLLDHDAVLAFRGWRQSCERSLDALHELSTPLEIFLMEYPK